MADPVIGLIGSGYFLGWMLSSTFLPGLADTFGRKWVLFFGCVFQNVLQVVNLLSRDIYLTIGAYFLYGASASIILPIATTFANELIISKYRAGITTLMAAVDASSMIWQVAYYYTHTSMYPLHWGLFVAASSFTLSLAICLPESPKFYYARGRYDQARIALKKIAKFNGVDPRRFDVIKFDNEVLTDEDPLPEDYDLVQMQPQ